jgi:hypothetical protein
LRTHHGCKITIPIGFHLCEKEIVIVSFREGKGGGKGDNPLGVFMKTDEEN